MTPREGGKKGELHRHTGELHRHTGELHRHSHLRRQVVLGSGSIRQLVLFSHTFGTAAWLCLGLLPLPSQAVTVSLPNVMNIIITDLASTV